MMTSSELVKYVHDGVDEGMEGSGNASAPVYIMAAPEGTGHAGANGDVSKEVLEKKMMCSRLFGEEMARRKTGQCNDDAFYMMDVGQLIRQYKQWFQVLPRVKPFYAVKCNNDPLILSVLAQLGCGFDCASKSEIQQVLGIEGVDVTPDRIIYANPCKTSSFIRHAASVNVNTMTFDNQTELDKIKKLFPNAKMVLRIAVSDPTAVCQLNLKFGAEPVFQATELLKSAARMGISIVGISFHVGSGCRDPTAYSDAIGHCRRLFDLGQELGHDMRIVDVGGGFPGFPSEEITFEEIGRVINAALDVHFPETLSDNGAPEAYPGLQIIAEPGRFFAAAAYILFANVISVKEVDANQIVEDAENGEKGFMYYLNDGVYGSFNCILYDHQIPYGYAVDKVDTPRADWTRCSIWGPTCDSFDCIMPNTTMPRLDAGDWLSFTNMGAYTIAAYSDFNGFERPDVVYVCEAAEWNDYETFRRRNTEHSSVASQGPLREVSTSIDTNEEQMNRILFGNGLALGSPMKSLGMTLHSANIKSVEDFGDTSSMSTSVADLCLSDSSSVFSMAMSETAAS